MNTHYKRRRFVRLLLASAGMLPLAGCAAATPTPTFPPAAEPNKVLPLPNDDLVGLAYHSKDKTLLLADKHGLSRWRAAGWVAMDTPSTTGLSAVVLNPNLPSTMYVSGPGLGVLRSSDGGASWKEVNSGLPNLNTGALAIHSFQLETLFVWVKNDGMYSTEDRGAHWTRVPDKGPEDPNVRSLVHSTLPGSMKTGWVYAATPKGIYLSMDCF